jgi:hypothetical protein
MFHNLYRTGLTSDVSTLVTWWTTPVIHQKHQAEASSASLRLPVLPSVLHSGQCRGRSASRLGTPTIRFLPTS